jgi:hypothetical protein
MCNELKRRPGWILCRNTQEIPVPSIDVLPSWAERGRLRPDDYLVNPIIESCVQVRDVPDLNAIFREARLRRLRTFVKKVLFWR